MSEAIRTIKNISLFIPHVFSNITEQRIASIFNILRIGIVKNVDLVPRMNNASQYNSAYVHFDEWYDNDASYNLQQGLCSGKEVKIVYDDPWFWVILENKTQKKVPGTRKAKIVLNESEDESLKTPVKQLTNKDFSKLCAAAAPKKQKQNKPNNKTKSIAINLENVFNKEAEAEAEAEAIVEVDDEEFEWFQEQAQEEEELDEIECAIESENKNLVTIDDYYLQGLEQENKYYHDVEEQHIAIIGRLHHQNNILMDEVMCLKAELSLLKENGFSNSEAYYNSTIY